MYNYFLKIYSIIIYFYFVLTFLKKPILMFEKRLFTKSKSLWYNQHIAL